MKRTYYFDMDGVLANFHKAYMSDKGIAFNRKKMATLEPFEYNVQLVRDLIISGVQVYILTKAANEYGRMGKIDWLCKHIPELSIEHFLCIVGYGRKVDYIKEEGILIDDDIKNIRQWEKEGHIGYWLEMRGEHIAL